MRETEEKAESQIITSNLPEAQTGKSEEIDITGATSWMRKVKYIEAGDKRIDTNT